MKASAERCRPKCVLNNFAGNFDRRAPAVRGWDDCAATTAVARNGGCTALAWVRGAADERGSA